jgi:tRNA(fMet)-specific endonuclease VapC
LEELENKAPVCVDTNILVDFLRKKEPGSSAYKRIRDKRKTVFITSITAFELLFGSKLLKNPEKRSEEALSLIEQHSVIPFDKASAGEAAAIGAELRRSGKEIEVRDLFNASICVAHKIPLATQDKRHYQRVSGLELSEI